MNTSKTAAIVRAAIVILSLTLSRAVAGKILSLDNHQLSLSINSDTAGITQLHNKLSGEAYRLDDPGFLVELETGNTPATLRQIRPADCSLQEAYVKEGEVRVAFTKGPARIVVSYHLDPQDSFAVKRVRVDYAGEGSFNVNRLEMFDWGLNPQLKKAIPYYGYLSQQHTVPKEDGDIRAPSNSTAFFMQYDTGGMFNAISCDYVFMHQDKSARCRSVYWPGLILKPGETFESEMGLIGVYRRKGFFHKPYSTTDELGGEFLKPNVDVRLDRAEMDGVRAAVQKFLRPERYTFVANGWAMGLPSQITTAKALEQYKQAINIAGQFLNVEGIHFIDNFGGLSREFAEHGFNTPYPLNPFLREAFDYARQKGIGLFGFVWASRGQPAPNQPGLLTLNAKGERNRGNIAFTKQYTDFIVDMFAKHAAHYPHFKGLTFDFLYLYPDYDPDHGYLTGTGSLYAQWANTRNLLRRLRQQHPDWMLRTQIGWRQHGPWMAEHSSFVHNSMDPSINVHRNFWTFTPAINTRTICG